MLPAAAETSISGSPSEEPNSLFTRLLNVCYVVGTAGKLVEIIKTKWMNITGLKMLPAAAESSISEVKRRGSPAEEPNPLITQLVNDTFIKGVACVLAVDENVVGMAEKILEGTLDLDDDLDAWQHFTSLRLWQNYKLSKKYPTMMGPKQQHFHQQIQETKARILSDDDPSLNFLFASREHVWIVLILVILFWSRDYVHPLDDDEDDDDDDDETSYDSEREPCCEFDDDQVNMLKSFKNEEMMKNLAEEVKKDDKIYETLQELLGTLHDAASPLGAQKHFDKVKEVWGNPRFIDILLKVGYRPSTVSPEIANSRLSKYIMSCIKKDPLFEVILGYNDPGFVMRVALSIFIGFWSNQENILPLVCAMGGDDLGVDEEAEPSRDWMLDTPDIMEFYRDKSIGEVADQLKQLPKATLMARSYLELSLRYHRDCFCSDCYHTLLAAVFWSQPSVILKLNEAMKKNPNLLRVLTKYFKGAESLRRQERMSRVMKDVQLELMTWKGSDDSDSKTRLALSILFGYWVDGDVTKHFRTLCEVQERIGKVVYSSGEEIAAFYYYARCATDVEGLESWLAKKYGKASEKALYLAKQIGDYQIARVEEYANKLRDHSDYSDWTLYIEVVLKNESTILAFSLYVYRFESSSTNTYKPSLFVGQQTVLC